MKQTSGKVELVEVDKSSPTSSKGSGWKDFALGAGMEIAKTVGPTLAEALMNGIEDYRTERKAFRQDMRTDLQEEHKLYMELIRKEEDQEVPDKEKLDRYYAGLDKIRQERKEIEEKSNRGLLRIVKSLKDLVTETKK